MPNIGKSSNESVADRLRDEEEYINLQDGTINTTEGTINGADVTVTPSAEVSSITVIADKAVIDKAVKEMEEIINKPTRTRKQAPKTVAPQNLVEMYKEKIELIQYVSGSTIEGNFPETLSKAGRDMLMEYSKSLENLKNEYLLKIQQL